MDLSGNKKKLTRDWYGTGGLAWAPNGEEVWFTASELGVDHYLSAVNLAGKERLVTRIPGTLVIFDIWHDGRVLLARVGRRREVMALSEGEAKERDLSWLDYSYPADLSADGKTVLFDEEGVGGGVQYQGQQELTYAVYIRNTDGSPAIRLGEGCGGRTLAGPEVGHRANSGRPEQLGCCRPARAKPAAHQRHDQSPVGALVPDGKRFVFAGNEPRHGVRLYMQELAGGKPKAISPEGVDADGFAVSPDGQLVVGIGPDGRGYFYPWRAASRDWSTAW